MEEVSEKSELSQVLERLRAFYGPLPQPPHEPFAMYVWEVLNFHAAPVKRDAALMALRRIRALTPDSVWKAVPKKLEAAVHLAGPYLDERIRALRTGADLFRRHPELARRITGAFLDARRALRALPQLGLAGTHRMLLFGGGHSLIPADAHLTRVAVRLGYAGENLNVRRQIREVRKALLPQVGIELDERRRVVTQLEHHGQATCLEHDPHCHICPLLSDCRFGQARATSGMRATG